MATEQQEFTDFEVEADFENIKEFDGGNFPLVAEGEYNLEIEHVEQKPSSNNNQMIVVTSRVLEEQDTPEAAAFSGQKLWTNYVLVPQSMGRLKTLMIACGAPLDKFRASAIMGARYRGTVVHSQGAGVRRPDGTELPPRTFANVTRERPIGGEEQQAAAPTPPPVTKAKPTSGAGRKATPNGAARRA
jgi:hypothetical protein